MDAADPNRGGDVSGNLRCVVDISNNDVDDDDDVNDVVDLIDVDVGVAGAVGCNLVVSDCIEWEADAVNSSVVCMVAVDVAVAITINWPLFNKDFRRKCLVNIFAFLSITIEL